MMYINSCCTYLLLLYKVVYNRIKEEDDVQMKKMKRRDFCMNASKYLKECLGGELLLESTRGDVVVSVREADSPLPGSVDKPKSIEPVDVPVEPEVKPIEAVGGCETECGEVMGSDAYYAEKAHRMAYYGCGCDRIPGSSLCPKHGRM